MPLESDSKKNSKKKQKWLEDFLKNHEQEMQLYFVLSMLESLM